MNGRRSRWIAKLFIASDPGLILSMNSIYGKDQTKLEPRKLHRRAKRMWSQHDPATKTWGKMSDVKLNKKGMKNDR